MRDGQFHIFCMTSKFQFILQKNRGLFDIATKFNDEARAKLVLRWEQLERERMVEKCMRHLLVTDMDVMREAKSIIGL